VADHGFEAGDAVEFAGEGEVGGIGVDGDDKAFGEEMRALANGLDAIFEIPAHIGLGDG
jgi:hypothetical protein